MTVHPIGIIKKGINADQSSIVSSVLRSVVSGLSMRKENDGAIKEA